jgi:transposase
VAQRAEHVAWQAEVEAKDLVFLDECGIKTTMTPSHAYAPRGRPVVDKVPYRRGPSTTVLGAMDCDGMLVMMTIDEPTNKAIFLTFLAALLPEMPGKTLVMDNLRVHHAKEVHEACAKHGVRIKYLPPYSPDLNPIEPAWFWIKDGLRKARSRNREALDDHAETLFHRLPAAHARGWLKLCGHVVAP